MSLRTILCWILPFALLAFSLGWARGDESMQPPDVFLQGFMMLREVRKLEAAGDYQAAARKCQEAGEVFYSIAQQWPAWQPDIVEGRRKKVRENCRRLQERAIEEGQTGSDALTLPQRQTASPGVRMQTGRDLPNGIATPPRAVTPRQKFNMLEQQVNYLRDVRAGLLRQIEDHMDNAKMANRNLGIEREKVANLEGELAVAQEELDRLEGSGVVALKNQVEELKGQLALATEKLAEQNAHTDELLAAYEDSQQQVAELRRLAEDLTQQRDDMAAIIKGLQTGGSPMELVTENATLREQLNATQARVDELELDKIDDQAEIARLREEVSQLRLELAAVKQENEAYKERLAELQGSLDDIDRELAIDPSVADSDAARHENGLLRQIISRQLKRQAFRQQARELIIGELQDLEAGSDELVAKIDSLVEEAPLSEEEQAVLRSKTKLTGIAGPAGVTDEAPKSGDGSVDGKTTRFAEAAAYNFGIGRYESAAIHYEEILEFAPQHVETLCNLGVTKIYLNRVDEARDLFDRAILADETSSRAHFMRGVACFYLDDSEAAVASIKKAMEIEPDNSELPSFLGAIYTDRGDWENAIEALTLTLNLQPSDAVAHYNLSYALLNQEQPDPKRAQEHYHKSVKHGLTPNERLENYFKKLKGQMVGTSVLAPAS